MSGQFPGGKYLDDLNPDELTDEQKQALTDLLHDDPYAFYNLFRDPDSVQRKIEGDDAGTTPVNELFAKLGALRVAGAPENVVEYWRSMLENRGRPAEEQYLPRKTKPNKEKLRQIDDFVKNINDALNGTDDYRYDPNDEEGFPESSPFSQKWTEVMLRATGEPLVEKRNHGFAKHYKATDPTLASMGGEIVEIAIEQYPAEIDLEAYKYTGDPFDAGLDGHINPGSMTVRRNGDATIITLEYYNVYE